MKEFAVICSGTETPGACTVLSTHAYVSQTYVEMWMIGRCDPTPEKVLEQTCCRDHFKKLHPDARRHPLMPILAKAEAAALEKARQADREEEQRKREAKQHVRETTAVANGRKRPRKAA